MSLQKYTSWAWQIAQGFKDSISDQDAEILRRDLQQMGESGWLQWVDINHKTVFSVLGMTPEKRAKRKDWADPIQRSRICFAAFHKARLAALTPNAADQLGVGMSYRSTCQHAAHIGEEILKESLWFWPFYGKPPFHHWQPPNDSGFVIPGMAVLPELGTDDN